MITLSAATVSCLTQSHILYSELFFSQDGAIVWRLDVAVALQCIPLCLYIAEMAIIKLWPGTMCLNALLRRDSDGWL